MSVSALRGLAPLVLPSAPRSHTPLRPPPHAQVPGFYLQRIGSLRVAALFDGRVALTRQELTNVDPAEHDRLLAHAYVPEDENGVQTAVNAYLIQDGSHLSLVDTGTAQCMGPGLGQVLSHLRAAGYDPAQVDDVLLTHAHPDHLCGLLDAHGAPAFPNATVWLSDADAAYWLDPASEADAMPMVRFAFRWRVPRWRLIWRRVGCAVSSPARPPCRPASRLWTAGVTRPATCPIASTAAPATHCWCGAMSCTITPCSLPSRTRRSRPTAIAPRPSPHAVACWCRQPTAVGGWPARICHSRSGSCAPRGQRVRLGADRIRPGAGDALKEVASADRIAARCAATTGAQTAPARGSSRFSA